jgi:hypothetical protein
VENAKGAKSKRKKGIKNQNVSNIYICQGMGLKQGKKGKKQQHSEFSAGHPRKHTE